LPDSERYEAQASPEAYLLFRRGSEFLDNGHPGAAAQLLARACSLAPGKTSVREALGRAYYALGRYERSEAEFRTVVEDAPTNDYAHFGLGCSLGRLGRTDEARRHLRLAVAMAPQHEAYRERLARLDGRRDPQS
jgi:Flp pilus assembly protein TadD